MMRMVLLLTIMMPLYPLLMMNMVVLMDLWVMLLVKPKKETK